MWDYDFDAEAGERDYYEALYGAAATDVKAYYDLLENALIEAFRGVPAKPQDEAMIASFFNRYPGANNPGVYLAAYWPILPQMKQAFDQAFGKRKGLAADERERLERLKDHHDYTMHTVAGMIFVGRMLTNTAGNRDRKAFEDSLRKRDAAKARIAAYRPFFSNLIDELDTESHTGVLYGKQPTIDIRSPSDFND